MVVYANDLGDIDRLKEEFKRRRPEETRGIKAVADPIICLYKRGPGKKLIRQKNSIVYPKGGGSISGIHHR